MMNGKLAIVGCGNWGRNLVRNFYQLMGAERIICCDTRPSILRNLSTQYPGIGVTADMETLWADPLVAAVAIATPAVTHYAVARQALLAGKHVLVEKPMTTSTQEAAALCGVANRAQRVLMVDHLLLFHPAVQELQRLTVAGELGDIYHLYSRRTNTGILRSEENALWSLGPHDVAVMLSLVGDLPVRVAAQGGTYLQPHLGIEDVVFLTLVFPHGQVANLHLSWLDPQKVREIVVVGSRRMAVFNDMEPLKKLRIYDTEVTPSSGGGSPSIRSSAMLERALPQDEPLSLTCRQFLESVDRGYAALSDGRTGLEVVRVLEAAQLSLERSGKTVEFSRE
jgi:predicted dehydrogenase